MKKILTTLALIFSIFSADAQSGNLPSGYLGSVLSYSYGTQTYNYSFTPTTSGVDYVGFAFRQDPGFWTFTNPDVTAGNSSTNLLINGNLQYGGGLSVNTTNYGTQYIQAPSDWGVWYQTGIYPSAAGYWSPGQWYDGAVGSYDGIYQGINVTAGTTYHISFNLSGTNPSSNPSIEVGTYMGPCAAGTSIFTCVPNSSASMAAIAAPSVTQSVGGAPPPPTPSVPTVVSTTTTNQTQTTIVGNQQIVTTTPVTVTTYSDGSTTTTTGNTTNSVASHSPFTGVHFGAAQVADTQWNVQACTQTSTCQVYSTRPGGTYETGSWLAIGSTQYITFIPNTASDAGTNPWRMILVNSDGSFTSLGTGRVLVQGQDSNGQVYLFFTNSNFNGTLLSGNLGLTGQGVTFTGTANPTPAQTETIAANMSPTPLAPGQSTAPVLCCGGSSAQFNADTANVAMVNQFIGRTTNNSQVYIQQVGDGNTIRVDQEGTKNNYAYINNAGSNNNINVTQTGNASTITNYSYNNINGNSNTVNVTQTSTGGAKGSFINVSGNSNNVSLTQTDSGSHYAEIGVSGGNKSVDVTQSGSASQMASIQLSGNPTSLSLQQTGSTQNFYAIQFNCATAGGCPRITVTQGH